MSIIRLTICNSTIEANMLQNLLENEGIESFLTNENFTSMMPGLNGMMGSGVGVMIEEADLERASLVLKTFSTDRQMICPNCDSTNVSKKELSNARKVLYAILAFVPFSNIKNAYVCNDCKKEFFTDHS